MTTNLSPTTVPTALDQDVDEFVRGRAPHLHSVVAVMGGQTMVERYYAGVEQDLTWRPNTTPSFVLGNEYTVPGDASQVHNVKSVTKSITSALLGICVADGLVSPQTTIGDCLGPRHPSMEGAKAGITLEHLATMRSGLAWEENGEPTLTWMAAADLVDAALGLPLETEPGRRYVYSTADTHLLGACLTEVTGVSLLDLADDRLFGPLGFRDHRWTRDPTGYCFGGSELYLRPVDMARFGRLYLSGGEWDGGALVSPSWIASSTAAQDDVGFEDIAAGMPLPAGDVLRERRRGYGTGWWRGNVGGHDIAYAAGFGGQLILLFDALDLVVVQTAATVVELDEITPERADGGFQLVERVLLPALS